MSLNKNYSDRVLEFFLENPNISIGSNDLAKELDCTEVQVIKAKSKINHYHNSIWEHHGTGENMWSWSLRKTEEPVLRELLSKGGFTQLEREEQKAAEVQKEREDIVHEQHKLQIQNLREASKDNKITRRISILALLMAALTLILEIVRFLFEDIRK